MNPLNMNIRVLFYILASLDLASVRRNATNYEFLYHAYGSILKFSLARSISFQITRLDETLMDTIQVYGLFHLY